MAIWCSALQVLSQEISQDLVSAILPVVLTLMAQLRQSFAASRNMSLASVAASTSGRDSAAAAGLGLPAGPLHSVLVSVCEAISTCSFAQRRHRAYLYGALLNYLQLCADAASHEGGADSSSSTAQERAFGKGS